MAKWYTSRSYIFKQILIHKQRAGIAVELACLRVVMWRAVNSSNFPGSIERGIFLDTLSHYQRLNVAILYMISFSAISSYNSVMSQCYFKFGHVLHITKSGRHSSSSTLHTRMCNDRERTVNSACPVLSYPVLSCPVLSCPVLSSPVLSCFILSCPIQSCPVLFYPVLSYTPLLC
jgi:hypothetical protein